ncbi:hypothetical protein BLOT_011300, partial [Blomia tropicalis]
FQVQTFVRAFFCYFLYRIEKLSSSISNRNVANFKLIFFIIIVAMNDLFLHSGTYSQINSFEI